MRKKDYHLFLEGLKESKFEHPSITFIVHKNKKIIEEEVEQLKKLIEPSEEVKEFTKEREELAKQFAERDEEGNPKIKTYTNSDGSTLSYYEIPGQDNAKSEYTKAFNTLKEKYKEALDTHQKLVTRFNEVTLEEKADIEIKKIKLDFLAENEKCPQEIMDKIHWMIEE